MAGFRSEVMVGRERELNALREVAARARTGAPAAALLLGEAGIGKTRLATELVAELEADTWLCPVSHGVALTGGELPFGATVEMLRAIIRAVGVDEVRQVLGREAVALAPLLPALGRVETSHVDRAAVLGAVLSLLEGLGRPLTWVLDDLQWMDGQTKDVVTCLSRVLAGVPVLLLGTVRTNHVAPADLPEELGELGRIAHVQTLASLTPEQVEEQLRGIAATDLDREDVARICEVSDGLPFFVEQLAASGGRPTGSVRSVVLSGFRDLSPESKTVLRVAAIGEGLLVPAYLREVTGLGAAFDAALSGARESGMLRPAEDGELLRFRHALLREALEAELLAEERRELHVKWARHIEHSLLTDGREPRLVMERARHRYAVGGDEALIAAVDAARTAEQRDDDRLTLRWWSRALELWPATDERSVGLERDALIQHYMRSLWSAGQADLVDPLVTRELADEDDWLRTLWLRLAQRWARRACQVDHEALVPPAAAAATLEKLRGVASDFRSREAVNYLCIDWRSELPDLVTELLEDQVEQADPVTEARVVQDAFAILTTCDMARGEPDRAVARAEQAVEWTRRYQPWLVLEARTNLIPALLCAGRCSEAIDRGEANLVEIRDRRLRPKLWIWQHIFIALAGLTIGDWDRTARCLDALAVDTWEDDLDAPVLAERQHVAPGRGVAAQLLARRGRLEEARVQRDAIPEIPPIAAGGEGSQESIWRAIASLDIAAAEVDLDGARTACGHIAELTPTTDIPIDIWISQAVGLRIAARADKDAYAAFLDTTLVEVAARPSGGRLPGACRAEIDIHAQRVAGRDTADDWAATASHWADLGRSYDVAWCRVFEAECAARDGERARATTVLGNALATADKLGAVPLRERVLAAARRWRIEGAARADAAAGLTSREIEVVGLLAEGLTNAQIAERLYMSPKTASVHVSHVIAKLGVANRTQAAAVAHRKGLVGDPGPDRS